MDQQLPVGVVVDEEVLLRVPGAEVGAEEGKHPVFGLDLPYQHPLLIGEAEEPLEQMGLAPQVLHRLPQHVDPVVGEIPGDVRPPLVAQPQETVHVQLPLGQTGEKSLGHQPAGLGGDLFGQRAVHPLRLGLVGVHMPLRPEGEAVLFR